MAGRWARRGVWGRTQGSDVTQTGLAGVIAGLSILVGQREAELGDTWVGVLSLCRTGAGETGGGSEREGDGAGESGTTWGAHPLASVGDMWSRCPSRGSASLHLPSLTPPALHLRLRPRGQHACAGGCCGNALHARTPPWVPTCFAKHRVRGASAGSADLGSGGRAGRTRGGGGRAAGAC